MKNSESSDDQLISDIFGTATYEAATRQKKNFLPWHKPRKQFVRERQWCKQIEKLLDDGACKESLRYLGLPGEDLLDLRLFHDTICLPKSLKLIYLGFNRALHGSSPEINISADEVSKLPLVDSSSSMIIPDDFCQVGKGNSVAWKRAREIGPFDVINLDLCDGLAGHAPGGEDGHYSAIQRLLTLQAKRTDPWLLFITTRAGKEHVHFDVLARFLQQYITNLENEEFQQASAEEFAITDGDSLEIAVSGTEGFLKVFLVGLCKWILSFVMSQRPPTTVEVASVIGYRVAANSDLEDLVSLALRFNPTFDPSPDKLGLGGIAKVVQAEGKFAAKALKRVARRVDADAVLKSDSVLNATMIENTSKLLTLARYDVSGYEEWAGSVWS